VRPGRARLASASKNLLGRSGTLFFRDLAVCTAKICLAGERSHLDHVVPGVLLVRRHADTREVTRRILELGGWSVVEAENGRVGLDRLASVRPGLILLDLMMPEMDGFEFVGELRKNPDWKSIPVVVVHRQGPHARRPLTGATDPAEGFPLPRGVAAGNHRPGGQAA
jgi:CheY-like chemotaxis protein